MLMTFMQYVINVHVSASSKLRWHVNATWTRLLAMRLQWMFWQETRCYYWGFESNWTAESYRHLTDTAWAVWRHVIFIFFFLKTLDFLTTTDFHWVEFFHAVKLQNGHIDYKMPSEPPLRSGLVVNVVNLNFEYYSFFHIQCCNLDNQAAKII